MMINMKKYFVKAGRGVEIPQKKINPVIISQEEYDYFQRALGYAKRYGFKIKLFDNNGKCFALQG